MMRAGVSHQAEADLQDHTAFHEAGHAVVAIVLGLPVKEAMAGAENLSDEVSVSALGAFALDLPDATVLDAWLSDSLICVALAGDMAERRRSLQTHTLAVRGADHDMALANEVLATRYPDVKARCTAYRWLARKTERILRQRWQAVELIAHELISYGYASGDSMAGIVTAQSTCPPNPMTRAYEIGGAESDRG